MTQREKIIDFLAKHHGQKFVSTDIAAHTRLNHQSVSVQLSSMWRETKVERRPSYHSGKYLYEYWY
jgi:DNA-binding IclR family transcriptional regulator